MVISYNIKSRGFTLLELLVVMAIIGILSGIGIVVYNQGLSTTRDSVRKNNLHQISDALEVYYQKNGKYITGAGTCSDSAGFYTNLASYMDNNTIPQDPSTKQNYCYVSVNNGASYRLFAQLENCNDSDKISGSSCGNWNYSKSSPDLTPTTLAIIPSPSPSPSPTGPFGYTLASSNSPSVKQTDSCATTINTTLTGGNTQSVAFSVSGLPTGATGSFSPTNCNPTCSSTFTLTTSNSPVNNSYVLTITGTSANIANKTVTLPIAVNANNGPIFACGALTATATSSTQVDLAFPAASSPTGIFGYDIYRCTGVGCNPITNSTFYVGAKFPPGPFTKSNTGLTSGTTYGYVVDAIDNNAEDVGYSNVVYITTP